ncbi:ankyrin repeat domain-containing protein 26-like, partial [Mercenaria mercenaria]|uniref:ankyrin repeat domain-containing protein 26-like n=1 Tax=Mercenaria mercenaria TaxID=6596 RepID=UPI00234E6C02
MSFGKELVERVITLQFYRICIYIKHSDTVFESSRFSLQALFTVNKYIHHGEDPNLLQDEESGNGWLHYAAKYNFKHVATKLFDHNIDSLARNKDEKTALEVAIDKKFDKMSALIARRMTQSDLQSLFAGVCSNIGSAVESDRISVGSSMDSNNIGSEVESDRNSVVLLMDS